MTWIAPAYSRRRVDRAGRALVEAVGDLPADDLQVADNWRSAHAFPLNALQVSLRRFARETSVNALVSQRLKRMPSTIAKLGRFPHMKLSRMQDVGGCRAVVATVLAKSAFALVEGCPPVPGTPSDAPTLIEELRACARRLERATGGAGPATSLTGNQSCHTVQDQLRRSS